MKKLIIAAILIAGINNTAKAQSTDPMQINTAQKAALKAQEGDPLVNGMPYSKWKAQVQAENKINAEAEAKAKAEQKKELEKMNSINIQPLESLQNNKSEKKKENNTSKK